MTNHVLLTAEAHRALRIDTRRSAALGDAVMSCVLMPAEFRAAQGDYPILFCHTPERDRFQAVALFGFRTGENLFLDAAGWAPGYLPLAMAIQPFLIGPPADGDAEGIGQVHLDLASPRVAADHGEALFDDAGRPTAFLAAMSDRLGALHAAHQEAGAFFAALARHELLEPLAVEMRLEDGSFERLVGFHAIDEERLAALDAWAIEELHRAGHLQAIFMALASLGKLSTLIARKNARLRRD